MEQRAVNYSWQPLTAADIGTVDKIANDIHTGLPERTEVFAEKISLSPRGARKLVIGRNIAGYAIAHPWKLHSIPPLDTFLKTIPQDADCLYAHDIAILPYARGQRASAAYIDHLKSYAREARLNGIACVSVYGTHVWWSKLGFAIVETEALKDKLASYGDTACYMIAEL